MFAFPPAPPPRTPMHDPLPGMCAPVYVRPLDFTEMTVPVNISDDKITFLQRPQSHLKINQSAGSSFEQILNRYHSVYVQRCLSMTSQFNEDI